MKQVVVEKFIACASKLIRRIPVNRLVKGFFIKRSLRFRDRRFHFTFWCPRIGIFWSAEGFPDLLTRHMIFEGMYQEDVLVALRLFARKGDVVFDVGGHHGLMAAIAAVAVGETGKVVTFEPNPQARTFIEKHLDLNGLTNVRIEKEALSCQNGTSALYVQSGVISWNTTIVKAFAGQANVPIPVATETLDHYVQRSQLIPQVIKIDTEGSEFMVLTGARDTIRQHHPVLIMEFNSLSAEAAGTTLAEYGHFLKEEGYDLIVMKRNLLGFYRANRHEPFCTAKHAGANKLINVVCIPKPALRSGGDPSDRSKTPSMPS